MNPEPIAMLAKSVGEEPSDRAEPRHESIEPSQEARLRRLLRSAALATLALGLVALGILLGQEGVIDGTLTLDRPSAGEDIAMLESDGLNAGIPVGTDEGMASGGDTVQFVGIVHPGTSVAVTAPFAGHITSIGDVAFGATVEAGKTILAIDSAEARRELKQAEMAKSEAESEYEKLKNWSTSSQVMQARREVENARRDVQRTRQRSERTKALLDEGIIAASEYEQELEALEIAESSLELAIDGHRNALEEGNPKRLELARQRFLLAREEVETLEIAIRQQQLIAPQRGILLPPPSNESASGGGQTALTIGRAVQKGEALVIIGDIETVQIKTFVSDVDIDRLALGQEARILTPAFDDHEVTGVIQSISKYTADFQNANASMSEMGPPVSRYEVIIDIRALELDLVDKIRVGMAVDIGIDDHRETADLGAVSK